MKKLVDVGDLLHKSIYFPKKTRSRLHLTTLLIMTLLGVLLFPTWGQLTFTSISPTTIDLGTYDPDVITPATATARITATGPWLNNGNLTTTYPTAGSVYYWRVGDYTQVNRKIPLTTGLKLYVYKDGGTIANNIVYTETKTTSNTAYSNFMANGYQDIVFKFETEIGKMIAPGSYSINLKFYLHKSALTVTNKPATSSPKTVTVSLTVPTIATMAIVSSGGAIDYGSPDETIAFGELSSGASQAFDIIVRANKNFNLNVETTSGGNLTSQHGATIPYTLVVGGSTANLASSPFTVKPNQTFSATQTRYASTITLGSFTFGEAGNYSDNLLFTLWTL